MKMKRKQKTIQTSFIKQGSILYELVGDEDYTQFVKYDPITEKVENVKSVVSRDLTYIPPENNLVESGTIKLATYPQEYGDTLALFKQVKRFIYKYVDVPDNYLTIATLYVILSWLFDLFDVIPYLRVVGDFGTGKSRFLQTVGSLCYKACFAGGASTVSPIFRIIDLYQGVTLVFDEADFQFSGATASITKILNTGYMKDMPVLRTEGSNDNFQPKSFKTYGPKIIASRNQFDDVALESRCLTQVMGGKPRTDIPRHLPAEFKDEAQDLRNKLMMFRLRNYFDTEVDPSLEMSELDSRLNQVALPILSITKDPETLEMVKSSLKNMQNKINTRKQDQEPAIVLRALVALLKEGATDLPYKLVASKINEQQGNLSEYKDVLTPRRIGRINSSNLDLETYLSGGITKIRYTPNNVKQIQDLARKYSIEAVDKVDLVELCFNLKEKDLEDKFTQEVTEALC